MGRSAPEITTPVTLVFSLDEIGEMFGQAAIKRAGLSGAFKAHVNGVFEDGRFKEIVVRLVPTENLR